MRPFTQRERRLVEFRSKNSGKITPEPKAEYISKQIRKPALKDRIYSTLKRFCIDFASCFYIIAESIAVNTFNESEIYTIGGTANITSSY